MTVAPAGSLMQDRAAERSLALLYLVAPSGRGLAALGGRQVLTDQALKTFEGVSRPGPVAADAPALDKSDAAALIRAAARLPGPRAAVRSRAIGVRAVLDQYSALIHAGYDVIRQGIHQTGISAPIVATAQQQTSLFPAADLALQESDLSVGSVVVRSFTPALRAEFTQLAGQRRLLVQAAVPQLDPASAALYRKYVTPRLSASLVAAENAVTGRQPPRNLPPLSPAAWSGAAGPYARDLGAMLRQGTIMAQVKSDTQAKLAQLIGSAGLGLAAVDFSIIFSILVGQLKGLSTKPSQQSPNQSSI